MQENIFSSRDSHPIALANANGSSPVVSCNSFQDSFVSRSALQTMPAFSPIVFLLQSIICNLRIRVNTALSFN